MNPGEKVSHYRIESLLGVGGMGVVYLADDLTLGRKVALKFLSREFARDRMAIERFRREARAASALNHPNLCTIYEISEHDGQPFISMEWLEGQSLREVMRKRRLSIDELISLAIHVADGLQAAHRAGVVHRDIKPGNIFVLSRGPAKLLDFGLAKMDAITAASELPTGQDQLQLTETGVTLGTVAYMSPEQARGERVDARTDLFSFGIVLYEAVTGVTPFTGSSPAVVFHEILGKNPPPPMQVNPHTPPDLDRLITKALEKDPDIRYQSAADLLSDLKRLKRDRDARPPARSPAVSEPTSVASPPTLSRTTNTPASSSSDIQVMAALVKRRRASVAVGAAVLILALMGIFYIGSRRPQDRPATLADLQVTQLTSTGQAERPAISPDGRFVAYISGNGLWIRQTATTSNVQIVPPEPGVRLLGLTVTPDNNFVDYLRVSAPAVPASLWRVPFLGAAAKLLIEDVASPLGWSMDGRQMAFIRADVTNTFTSLVLADADGRNPRILVNQRHPQPNFVNVYMPGTPAARAAWSPDGQVIAFPAIDGASGRVPMRFFNVSDGAPRSELPDTGAYAEWMDSSSLVINLDRQLWQLAYPGGNLSRLTNDTLAYSDVSLSADRNSLVTARTEVRGGIWIADGAAKAGTDIEQPLDRSIATVGSLAWASDQLLFTVLRNAIYRMPASGSKPEEVLKNASAPAVTSDGKTLVYLSRRNGMYDGSLWKAGADGQNPTQLVPGVNFWPQITPDDQSVLFIKNASGINQMWVVPLAGGTPTPVSKLFAVAPRFSPDGKRLAFVTVEKGRTFISTCEWPACSEPRRERAWDGGPLRIDWTPDGRGIAYAPIAPGSNIWVHPLDGSPEHQLTHFTDQHVLLEFAWSRDGKHFAVARASTAQDIVLFRGLKPKP